MASCISLLSTNILSEYSPSERVIRYMKDPRLKPAEARVLFFLVTKGQHILYEIDNGTFESSFKISYIGELLRAFIENRNALSHEILLRQETDEFFINKNVIDFSWWEYVSDSNVCYGTRFKGELELYSLPKPLTDYKKVLSLNPHIEIKEDTGIGVCLFIKKDCWERIVNKFGLGDTFFP